MKPDALHVHYLAESQMEDMHVLYWLPDLTGGCRVKDTVKVKYGH